jgi:hypothetical protein
MKAQGVWASWRNSGQTGLAATCREWGGVRARTLYRVRPNTTPPTPPEGENRDHPGTASPPPPPGGPSHE